MPDEAAGFRFWEGKQGFRMSDQPPEPLRPIDPSMWTDPAPPRRWIVPGWIPRGVVSGLYGDGGIGKSLLVQQLETCIARGMPWLGIPTSGLRCFGLYCEDDEEELHRRQEAINKGLGCKPGDLAGKLLFLSRLGMDNLLMTFDGYHGEPTPFFQQIIALLDEFRPDLVSLDTIADIFGGDEINRAQVRLFVQGVGGFIARRYDCGVLMAGHPSANGKASGDGSSGSTAWNNTFRSRLYLTRPERPKGDDAPPPHPDDRLLSRRKNNYGPSGGDLRIHWDAGLFHEGPAPAPAEGQLDWAQIAEIFDAIHSAWHAGRPLSLASQTKNQGRHLPSWCRNQLGIRETTALHYAREWLAAGYLVVDTFDARAKLAGLRIVKRLRP